MMPQRNARQVRAILADHGGASNEYAYAACFDASCSNSARIDVSSGKTDAELKQGFETLGWSIKPTLCPEHSSTRDTVAGGAPEAFDPCPVVTLAPPDLQCVDCGAAAAYVVDNTSACWRHYSDEYKRAVVDRRHRAARLIADDFDPASSSK